MTKVVYYVAASLDGFIAGPDGDVQWLNKYLASGEDYGFSELTASTQAILMGRETYQQSLTYDTWPAGNQPVWVMSSSIKSSDLKSVQITPKTPKECLAEMAEEGIERVWLMGGGELAASFLEQNLIHELDLALIPEMIGRGIPLFQPSNARLKFDLVETKKHPSGIVQLRYRQPPT